MIAHDVLIFLSLAKGFKNNLIQYYYFNIINQSSCPVRPILLIHRTSPIPYTLDFGPHACRGIWLPRLTLQTP